MVSHFIFYSLFTAHRKILPVVFLFALLMVLPARSQSALPSAASVAAAMRLANNYWITNNAPGNAGWARSVYYTGNQRAARVLGERAYYNWALAWGAANLWKIGPEGASSADAYCCGQTYLDIYRLNPQTNFIADIKAKTDAIVASPAVNGWWWIDAFYMQSSVLSRLGNLTGNTNYVQKLWQMYDDMKTARGLFDTSAVLWYRDGSYIYPTATNDLGGKVFWSRGNGWLFAALARNLQIMPTNAPHYNEFVSMFQNMAAALKPIQNSDGLWRSSLFDSNQFPNPETSGTSLFTYGMAWGVRNGLLPAADFTNTIALAWYGLTNLSLGSNGRVGYVQGVGVGPAAATASSTTDFGVGAFLLACSEIYLLAPDAPALRPWAGPDQTIFVSNQTATATISLDASQTEFYNGTATAYSWWEGANQIAVGSAAQTTLTLGTHPITLKVLASDSSTYTDMMTVTVTTNAVTRPVLKMQFGFDDTGITTTDSISGISLNMVNYSGAATDLHGALGTGVGGTGRCLDLTSATAQGGNGPLASAVGVTNFNFGVVSNFTITLWLKPRSTLLAAAFPRLFSLGTNGATDRGTTDSLQLLSNGNLISGGTPTSLQAFVNTTPTSTSAFGAFDMPTNQWRFVALTYDGATLNFYGGSETNAASLKSTASMTAGSVNFGNAFTIFLGNNINGSAGQRSRACLGQMDDVRFYLGAAGVDFVENIRAAAVAPPSITGELANGTNLALRINTRFGTGYILQSTTNLAAPTEWITVLTNTGTGDSITNFVPLIPAIARQFFRYGLQ